MDEDAALALGCHHEYHTEEVRRNARPWSVRNIQDRAIHERVYLIAFLLRNEDVITATLELHAELTEHIRNHSQFVICHILDRDGASVHGCQSYERADLDHVRKYGMLCASKRFHSSDCKEVRAYALDIRTHPHQHLAQLLEVWLAGCIIDGSHAFSQSCSHHDVGSTGNRRFVQKHIAALELPALRHVEIEGLLIHVVLLFGTEVHEAYDVRIDPAAANLVSARLREIRPAETGEERSYDHHGATELGTLRHKVSAHHIFGIDLVSLECVYALLVAGDLDAHSLEEDDQVLDVKNLRNVGDRHLLIGQEHRADYLQGLVLGTLRPDGSAELITAFYYK